MGTGSKETGCACCGAPADPGRRWALAVILAGAGTPVLGSMGLAAGFLSNALGRKADRPWIRLGRVDDTDVLNVETFQRHVVQVKHQHAWVRKRVPLDIYIKDQIKDGKPAPPLALLSTCSHLGCSVKWNRQESQFKCPCHGGIYDERGGVVSGPPPRALTRLEVKIEGDDCFVRLPQTGGGSGGGETGGKTGGGPDGEAGESGAVADGGGATV